MVVREEEFCIFPVLDAHHELIRLGRRVNTQLDEESLGHLMGDDQIEGQYRILLYYLLNIEESPSPCKKSDKKNYITTKKERSGAKADIGNGAEEEEDDPQYVDFLKHLKEHDKSYVLEYNKDGFLVVVKYEGDVDYDNKGDPEAGNQRKRDPQSRNKKICGVNERKRKSRKDLDRKMKQKMPRLETPNKFDLQPDSAKNAKNALIEECSAGQSRKVVAAKSFMAKKNIEENTLEKDMKGISDPDVEVHDEAACVGNKNSNPFVSSKKIFKSMENRIQRIGESSACGEYRKGVINVLKEPYDKEEYTRHVEAIQAGRYFDYHPDLQQKLKEYRYNRRKRLAILRGFFFWLQNICREGAFKPWNDRACLAVEPPEDGRKVQF